MGWSPRVRESLEGSRIGRWFLRRDLTKNELDRRMQQPRWKWLVYLGSLSGGVLTFLGVAALIPVPIFRYVIAAVVAIVSLNSWAALVILIAWPHGRSQRRE